MKPLVIYHANCTDGWTAAWVAAQAFAYQVELYAAQYGQEPPDVWGREVHILDFSYKRPVMQAIADSAHCLIVLDHHKTAEADLASFAEGNAAADCIFDMNRSGATLAWDWFHPGEPRPWLVEYVEDRDLWRWALPNSRLVNAGIELYERDNLEVWDQLARTSLAEVAEQGITAEIYKQQCVKTVLNLAHAVKLGGYDVLVANCSEPRFASDSAQALATGKPFGAVWWLRQDGMVQFSLRSTEEGIDVAEFAAQFGGGGHKHAAGFQLSFAAFVAMKLRGHDVAGES